MGVYLHAQVCVRPDIKKPLNTLINKALRGVAKGLGMAGKKCRRRGLK